MTAFFSWPNSITLGNDISYGKVKHQPKAYHENYWWIRVLTKAAFLLEPFYQHQNHTVVRSDQNPGSLLHIDIYQIVYSRDSTTQYQILLQGFYSGCIRLNHYYYSRLYINISGIFHKPWNTDPGTWTLFHGACRKGFWRCLEWAMKKAPGCFG